MKSEVVQKAVNLFDEGYACSQAILLAFSDKFDVDPRAAKLISSTFGGGMGRMRDKCGAVTGGFMVLGLAFGNEDPKDMKRKLEAYSKVRVLNKVVTTYHGTTNCGELIRKHASEADIAERKHHKIICRKVVADVAGFVWDLIENNE